MEFHISRTARDRYAFDRALFTLHGNVVFADFHAARVFAHRMNQKRNLARFPETAVRASEIHAMGLIDEILHFVVGLYKEEHTHIFKEALNSLNRQIGKKRVDRALFAFIDSFPPLSVIRGEVNPEEYMDGKTGDVPHREIILEELLMLWLANRNPAFSPYLELFDDAILEKQTVYGRLISSLKAFFEKTPPFGPDDQSLVDMLQSPALAVPYSLPGQLDYIRRYWGYLLGRLLFRILGGLDFIREEARARSSEKGIAEVLEYIGLEDEPEHFSEDLDWMPRVVMLAKNIHVWLDQLSKKYGKSIRRLDEIPDEELELLSGWGFTALWLIGLWERSRASKTIKQLCGNPDAQASAYSLYDYQIAEDLGGEEAFRNLKERAGSRGIRMAGDMVPNHVGIDGRWVIEHPDWFVSVDHSPFPAYRFNGQNLSGDERVGIFLEDHYYERSDAAVVFKRMDLWTGNEKYIYHGNDGTHMPWNDTAQLNFLNPEVREAVIRTIIRVARDFPIIRFDAAMTLTKRHFQRLWYPEPGTGGDIPTRSDHGMNRAVFDRAMPAEFWREVVDRVKQEMPDTLLLAEAFWLLEGYFVRTLGMHRVYNSAFMNMLKLEDNAKYRSVLKNTLMFDPNILKRFVNFMNNPDEETAVAQFGKGDKYFGVCTMMVTLPGLPMFGHGQIEGFTEKYGMEYHRAYWDEVPDRHLIERHEREIFPLLKRRELFAGVEDFVLYDFYNSDGTVNEDVFAYSNRHGNERSLVIYNNAYAEARGWLRASVSALAKGKDRREIIRIHLGEGLGLRNEAGWFTIFRDHIRGIEYIRNNRDLHEKGLYVGLGAYQCHVFLDFGEVFDEPGYLYAHLHDFLDGRGVPSIDEAAREIFLKPIHESFRKLACPEMIDMFFKARIREPKTIIDSRVCDVFGSLFVALLESLNAVIPSGGDVRAIADAAEKRIRALLRLRSLKPVFSHFRKKSWIRIYEQLDAWLGDDVFVWGCLFGWLCVHGLGRLADERDSEFRSRSWIDEWRLGRILSDALRGFGLPQEDCAQAVSLIKILTSHQRWFESRQQEPAVAHERFRRLLEDGEIESCLGVNRFRGVLWYHKESFEDLIRWLAALAIIDAVTLGDTTEAFREAVKNRMALIDRFMDAHAVSGFRLDSLLERMKEEKE